MQKKVLKVAGVAAAIALLVVLSVWTKKMAEGIEGPSRLAPGPHNTVHILVEGQLIKTDGNGRVLSTLELKKDMGITGPVADLLVEPDGDIVMALADTQLIQYYSPEGKLMRTHPRAPSSSTGVSSLDCAVATDPATGALYVADTNHNRIQIYGRDGKLAKTLPIPSGEEVAESPQEMSDVEQEEPPIDEEKKTFDRPGDLVYSEERLYIADTNNDRIVVLHADGALDRIIPTSKEEVIESGGFEGEPEGEWEGEGGEPEVIVLSTSPYRISKNDNTLVLLDRTKSDRATAIATVVLGAAGDVYEGVNVGADIDPVDILARGENILVADKKNLTIIKATTEEGALKPAGPFGEESLLKVFSGLRARRSVLLITSRIAFWALFPVILGALFLSVRKIRKDRAARGRQFAPVEKIRTFLGPVDSMRSRILTLLVPGLAQLAAGRKLRAGLLAALMLLFLWPVVIYSAKFVTAPVSRNMRDMLIFMLFALPLWLFIVVDGTRLARGIESRKFALKRALALLGIPLIPALLAGLLQLVPGSKAVASGLNWHLLYGWCGAIAGLAVVLGTRSLLGSGKNAMTALLSALIGAAGWWLSVKFISTTGLERHVLLMPLFGLAAGVALYLSFRGKGATAFIIPAGISGAWLGEIIRLIMKETMPYMVKPIYKAGGEAAVQMGFAAYFIALAVLLVLNTLRYHEKQEEGHG